MKKDQENDRSGIGGVIVGILIGFAVCLFLKEEEKKKIIGFLDQKTKRTVDQGKDYVLGKAGLTSSDLKTKPSRKRFFQKKTN
jgi:hypothetical protein